MNNKVRKKISEYKRAVEGSKVNTSIYSAIFVVTVLVFLFGGIAPFSRTLKTKMTTLKDLKALNSKLQTKNNNLVKAKDDIFSTRANIQELYKAVPQRSEIEDYMIALSSAAGTSGYKQVSLVIQGEYEDHVVLRAGFEGKIDQIAELVRKIETLERLTILEGIDYYKHENTATTHLVLKVFYLKESEEK